MASPRLVIRPFTAADPAPVAELLARSTDEYTRYFRPFEFEAGVLEALFTKSRRDQWFVIEVHEHGAVAPAGFYMLRGLDEGFSDPMYGVFVAEQFAGRGLARLTLAHAEAQCRLNGWQRLRLKVDPHNERAHRIYQSVGFEFEQVDPKNEDQVFLRRDLAK